MIRGQTAPRVKVLTDGAAIMDASEVSPDHAVSGEPLLLEGVEILRGPSALLYGGGAIGGACFGWFMHRFGVKRATMGALALSVLGVAHFGLGQTSLQGWTLAVIFAGLFTNSAVVGFYAAFAAAYPTHVKATGTGFALSVGRGGAALSPILAGLLFQSQLGLMGVALIMASGSLLALVLLVFLPVKDPDPKEWGVAD